MCDVFLVLAQAPTAASPASWCPASRPTASATLPHPAAQGQARQPLERLERGRVRRHLGAAGRRGGRGVPTIIEMVNHTRLDCVIGTAAGMRAGVAKASTTPRTVPRSAGCYRPAADAQRAGRPCARVRGRHGSAHAPGARLRRAGAAPSWRVPRLAMAVSKYWVCKRGQPSPARRWSASAATGMSRTRACRGTPSPRRRQLDRACRSST